MTATRFVGRRLDAALRLYWASSTQNQSAREQREEVKMTAGALGSKPGIL
jgi:hypothetical protein